MPIRVCKYSTPGTRNRILSSFEDITKKKPIKNLLKYNYRRKGRNHNGKITIRHRGGGHKRLYRIIDFKKNKYKISGIISSIEYDPNRNARIALVQYSDGDKRYIIKPENISIGSKINSGPNAPLKIGNSLPLKNIPLGSFIHNIELFPKKGGQIARAAGTCARLIVKEGNYVTVKLPSKEIRLIHKECYATIGVVSNQENVNIILGKAGRKRWLGFRPVVRGSAMNPCDHPHGGGEGRAPIGRKKPVTPWGKDTLGVKTRRKVKYSDIFILSRRK